MAFDKDLRAPRERTLFTIGVICSTVVWIALAVSIVGLVYGVLIAAVILAAHALFLAHVRGNGVRVSERQLPDLHARVRAAAEKLGLRDVPEVYVLQSGGVLNAFATKLLSRRYVVLYAALVDACSDPRQLEFVVGHELGHLAAGHLRWNLFLAPYHVIPWLGAAYSRAREYTCDRCGHRVSGDLEQSMRGLVVLAAGGRVAREVDLRAFMAQLRETGSFWMTVLELTSTHPFLCKRVAALESTQNPAALTAAPRSFFGWLLAPILGGLGGGPAAAPLMAAAILGVLAAIALPNFMKYQERARQLAGAPAAAAARASEGLSDEDRESLAWVKELRAQVEQQQRGASAKR